MTDDVLDERDRKTLDDIERFGCSVIHVLAEGDEPPFTYSVGITRSSSAPEVVVIGLKPGIAHPMVNDYCQRVRAGERFVVWQRYEGFLEGFEVEVARVDPSFHEEYFAYNLWLYEGAPFEVLQLVYPDTRGLWPWQTEASAWFRGWQRLLDPGLAARHRN